MKKLTEVLLGRGAALVAYADLRDLPSDVRRDMPFGVAIAVALDPDIVRDIPFGPKQAYCDEYRRVNTLLDELSRAAAQFLRHQGFQAIPQVATSAALDPETLSTRLPHKTVATRAGLGWIGKMALLVTEQFGSGVRITSVLTDAELPTGQAISRSRCGDCQACVNACPAEASRNRLWEAGMPREEVFDAFACRATTRDRAERAGLKGPSCGMCIALCPWTVRYLEGT